jgi:hypothetical protein
MMVNDEQGRTGKEEKVASFKVIFRHLLRITGGKREKPQSEMKMPTAVRTRHSHIKGQLSNTN